MARALSNAATVIGILTGIGTIVGWAASQNLAEAADTVLPIAGGVFILVSLGIAAWELLREIREGDRVETVLRAGVLLFLSLAILAALGQQNVADVLLKPMGVIALAFAAIQTPRYVRRRIRMHQRSRRECPDCKETIKAEANVCHYCGYRFRPSPMLAPHAVIPEAGSSVSTEAAEVSPLPTSSPSPGRGPYRPSTPANDAGGPL